MIMLQAVHHIAIICSDIVKSTHFYTEILGFTIISEVYRQERDSYKIDLALGDHYVIELFSFPNPPPRPSRPEATGLRHIAFSVKQLDSVMVHLAQNDVSCEPIRVDPYTKKRFTFFSDPDDLPIELYEV
jgi:glyoxylase I family protein